MSLLVLREVDAKAARDAALLRLFELCRGHVEHVAATPHVPHCVALATRGGFVQLVDLVSGEYRLFLTHLGHVPLDSALRCFALVVPPSSSSSSRDGGSARRAVWPRQVLLYSLASSNELLLADVDSGVVAVLAACRTRPSVAMCDAHYLIAGEGGGEVTVWRAEHDDVKGNMHNNNNDDKDDGNNNATPHLVHAPLWCRAVVDDTVTCLSRCTRDCLVCCSAACECVVVAVDSGVLLATLQSLSLSSLSSSSLLLPFASPVVAVLPRGDADDASRVVVCTATELRLLATAHKDDDNDTSTSNSNSGKEDGDDAVAVSTTDEVTAGQRRRLPSSSLSWRCVSTTHVDVAMQCVTCSRAYVVAGTASGVVLLFRCDGAHDAVVELVRFDVGFAVVSVQLYESDEKDDSDGDGDDDDVHLLVVTSAGDVWRWPLRTLVAAAAATTTNTNDDVDDAVTDDEGNDDDTSTTTTAETDTTMPHEDNAQTQQQQETEDDNDDDDAYEPRPHAQLPQPTAADTPTAAAVVDDKVAVHATRAHGGAATTSSPVDETADDAVVVVMADDDDDDDDKDAVMTLASLPPRQRHEGDNDDDDDDAAKQPRCDEDTRRSNNAAALATASEAANTTPPPPTMATMTSPRQLVEAAAAAQVTRALGPRIPAQTAAQLRRGRRMSRQMVTSLLANACDDDDDDDDSSDSNSSSGSSSSGDDDADAAVQLNSTLLLRAQYAALQRATFVPSRDVDATALDVQALQYRHPVVLPSYSPRARLYDAVPPLLTTTTTMTAAAAPAAAPAAVEQTSSATTSASPSPPATVAVAVHDDLMDATCLRRPHKRSVSRNAHKDDEQLAHTMLHIEEHGCDALLYGTLAHGTHATMTTTRAAATTAVSLLLRDDGDDDDDRDVAMSLQPDVPPLLLLPLPLPSSPAVF